MTLYDRFRKLKLDCSRIGFGPGDTRSDYFCTPKGATVIGWEGVDGIHYCFVKGFDDTVFAFNPSNLPGDYVHPLARSFEDFLRLLLACGSTAALEQAWMWNRGEFDAFLESNQPDDEQRAVLDVLGDKLSLTPMDDPYGYIKGIQSSFDYSKIPWSREYLKTVSEKPKVQEQPERPAWKVYFENGFGSYHRGHDKPGTEITVNKIFNWGGRIWHIPAVYSCGKGLVIDFCVEVDLAAYGAFWEKWRPWWEGQKPLTPEEEQQQMSENPMTVDFSPKATVNGRELRPCSGNGSGWTPISLRMEYEQGAYSQQDWESIWLMKHYGLDAEKGWVFWRQCFPWATQTRPKAKTLTLAMSQDRQAVPGPRFTVSGVGDTIPFIHPVTGEAHILRVAEYEDQKIDLSSLLDDFVYPNRCTAMTCVIEPDLPRSELTIRDSEQGDSPRPNLRQQTALEAIGGADGPAATCSVGIIGGVNGPTACFVGVIGRPDGPTAILSNNIQTGCPHSACSALRFETPEQIEWRMEFYQKTVEDIEIELPLPQN